MKSIEFLYWMQGPLEVCYMEELTEDQIATIQRHLNMAFITDKPAHPFCYWLQGVLDATEHKALSGTVLKQIESKLNDCFEHHVPSFKQPTQEASSPTGWPLSYLDEEMLKPVRC